MKLAQQNKKSVPKRPRISKTQLFVRIMAGFLCALMVLGVLAILIPFLGFKTYANDDINTRNETAAVIYPKDLKIRVGLMYGTGVTVGFQTQARHGFNIGSVSPDNKFTKLWQVADPVISVTCDANLSKNKMTYLIASSEPKIGGYNIQIPCDANSTLSDQINYYSKIAGSYSVFPAYINKNYYIRIGHFSNESSAASAAGNLGIVNAQIASPSHTGVSVINPNDDIILFEYDCGGITELGLTAVQGDESRTFLVTPANNSYEGIFEYSRYRSGNTDGVELINILTPDEYVTGVLPWEIGINWPIEVQKAFAITARTFAISMINRHGSLGFDMCNGTHCQAYMGVGRANDLVRQSVNSTTGLILTYNGAAAKTYYSAVCGGVTVSAFEAWGGSVKYPYLVAVSTPWEDYESHEKGEWQTEVTPTELLNTLRNEGYSTLRGSISDIKINSLAKNSSYVYSITFTDIYGTSVTVNTTDKIRITLSDYVNSANFVVAKAGQTVTVTNYNLASDKTISVPAHMNTDVPMIESCVSNVTVITGDGSELLIPKESINIVKDIGSEIVIDISNLTVLTSEGTVVYNMNTEIVYNQIPTDTTGTAVPINPNDLKDLADLSNILSIPVVNTSEQVKAEGKEGNFVFIGRGWGHGVGMSQYGAMNLAELGYDCFTILKAYFPGTDVVDLSIIQ